MLFKRIEEYISCILFNLIVPLLPLFLEKWFVGTITNSSLMIATAIYAISVGNESSHKSLFSVSVIICIIFSACFGLSMIEYNNITTKNKPILPEDTDVYAIISIVAIFIASISEKYTKYIVDNKKCLNFN